LEQCKRVYDDLVNQYKSLAKKIDERIHWSELEKTANQLSAERHKLKYRLRELEEEEEKRDREERARMAKRDKEERGKRDKEERLAKREASEIRRRGRRG
jgi:hypothetical protein